MNQNSQEQPRSDRSYVDLGLLLTQKLLSVKTKLKQINPTLIYEWDGQTSYNQISGKGIFRVRNSHTNQIVYQCEIKQWKNGVPEGQICMKKINFFSNPQIGDYKVKQIQIYLGGSQNLKKHGKGSYTFQQFYSSGKVKKTTILGEWSNDILIAGTVQNQYGKKDLNLSKNIQWSKSTKSITIQNIQSERKNEYERVDKKNLVISKKQVQQKQSKVTFKDSTNLVPQAPKYQHKYLDPVKLR